MDVSLPNGMVVSCLQKHEVPLINMEVQGYIANGIRLQPGDTVFDVGANIGLFSLAAYAHCERNLRLFAFEPVAAICELLQVNLRRNASQALVRVCGFGLSHTAGSIHIAYYPRAPVLSTAYPDEANDLRLVENVVLNNVMQLDQAPLALRCLRWVPRFLRASIVRKGLKRALCARPVTCEMQTLSQFVGENGIEQIDLLKIDVEKAELDVLRGIDDQDWPKIQQVVVETHDLVDRVRTITALLVEHGLTKIVVEQPLTLKDTNIYTIFATRSR